MPIVLGVDLGTTKITCIGVDTSTNEIVAIGSSANDANVTRPDDRLRGHSEWRSDLILTAAQRCLETVTDELGTKASAIAGIGVTGQQHGVVLVDRHSCTPKTPLINWQDRRSLELIPGSQSTWLEAARLAIGGDAWKRTGCWLHPGFMAVTLYELNRRGELPSNCLSLFIMDYFVARLTGKSAVTEPSCAGSSGIFDVHTRQWSDESILALGLSRSMFPEVREADHVVGGLSKEWATSTGLREGIPVFAPIGDHQASFVGSVLDRKDSILVNVGTGAQVAVFTDGFKFDLPIELRPCPLGGNLLSNVGLAGGWSYQILEQFFRNVGTELFKAPGDGKLYEAMNRLAKAAPAGADGLKCEPRFSGTRLDPAVRGSITGISPQNFTASHFARAVLEGMGRSLHDGYRAIQEITGQSPKTLVAAGNGLRENPILAEVVSSDFGLPLTFTRHREEAAFGAATMASIGAGVHQH